MRKVAPEVLLLAELALFALATSGELEAWKSQSTVIAAGEAMIVASGHRPDQSL